MAINPSKHMFWIEDSFIARSKDVESSYEALQGELARRFGEPKFEKGIREETSHYPDLTGYGEASITKSARGVPLAGHAQLRYFIALQISNPFGELAKSTFDSILNRARASSPALDGLLKVTANQAAA